MISMVAIQAATALTLVCSGTVRTGPLGLAMPEAQGEPFDIVYRIDLDARTWCADACESREPIAMQIEGMIVLRDHHGPDTSHVITLTPSAGRFSDTLIDSGRATLRSGRCLPSGFDDVPDRVA